MAKTVTTKLMGDLDTKEVRTIRLTFLELLAGGTLDVELNNIAEAVLNRGDEIAPDPSATAKKTTATKKTETKKTDTRLPSAPTAKKKEDDQEEEKTATEKKTDAPALVLHRNYTIPGDKFAGAVGKYVGPGKRAGSGRFRIVVANDTYAEGKHVVIPGTVTVKPTRQGPRGQ